MANGTAVRVFLDALASASVGAAVGAAVLLGVRLGADRLTTWRLHHVEARNCERCAAMVRRTRDGAERDLNDACSTLDELEKCAFYVRRHGETFYSEKNVPLARNANRVPYKHAPLNPLPTRKFEHAQRRDGGTPRVRLSVCDVYVRGRVFHVIALVHQSLLWNYLSVSLHG